MNLYKLADLYYKLAGKVIQVPDCQGYNIDDYDSLPKHVKCSSLDKSIRKRDNGKFQCDKCYEAELSQDLPEVSRDFEHHNFRHLEFTPTAFWKLARPKIIGWVKPGLAPKRLVHIIYEFKDCLVRITSGIETTVNEMGESDRSFKAEIMLRNSSSVDDNREIRMSETPIISDNKMMFYARNLMLLGSKDEFNCQIIPRYGDVYVVMSIYLAD